MIISPVICNENLVYARMKGIVWCAEGLKYPNMIRPLAGKELACLVKEKKPDDAFVVNCQGVVDIDDHALDAVKKALDETSREVIFINAKPIETYLNNYLGPPIASYHSSPEECTIVYSRGQSINAKKAERLSKRALDLERKHLGKLVKGCFVPNANGWERMSSTPLLATGIFNARSLITDPSAFVKICLVMAEEVEKVVQKKKPLSGRLFAVSLRGSPFASAVYLLNDRELEIEIVDHMGPRHKILEEYSLAIGTRAENYICVGDFIIGGTQLKIAQMYVHSKACSLDYAVVIGCALDPEDYHIPMKIVPIVDLSKCCPMAMFKFMEKRK